MSVIGRLDDQVEAVLINPLKRRDAPDAETRDESKPAHVPPENAEHKPADEPTRERHDEEPAALPVWLL